MNVKQVLEKWLPIVEWLPKYKWSYLKDDIIAGFTVSTVIVPQSLAYSLLAGLPATNGLYIAVIPPLVYTFFGTNVYNSIGLVFHYQRRSD